MLNELNYSARMLQNELIAGEAALGRKSFFHFVKLCWHIIEPNTPFEDGWHLRLLCDYMEACLDRKIRNLIVNCPPRHAKSSIISICLVPWIWCKGIKFQSQKFLYASHSEDLALSHSKAARDLIQSDFYQERWGPLPLAKDANQAGYFRNMRNGYRKSFGVNSKISGEGGGWLIADDALDAKDSTSEAKRNAVNEWYQTAFSNRIVGPKTVVKIIAAQRLNEMDLCGFVKQKGQTWDELILPARYEGRRYTSSIGLDDKRTVMGEPLWPEVFGEEELNQLALGMSELMIAGQLQQRPTTFNGVVYEKRFFEHRAGPHEVFGTYLSFDTASKDLTESAYTACVVGQLTPDYHLIIKDVQKRKVKFPELLDFVEEMISKWRYRLSFILIEDKSSGTQLIQTLIDTADDKIKNAIIPIIPKGEKLERAFQGALWCEKSMVKLPYPNENELWLADFEKSLYDFPSGKFVDDVDAFNQLIIFLDSALEEGLAFKNAKLKEGI